MLIILLAISLVLLAIGLILLIVLILLIILLFVSLIIRLSAEITGLTAVAGIIARDHRRNGLCSGLFRCGIDELSAFIVYPPTFDLMVICIMLFYHLFRKKQSLFPGAG